MSLKEDCQKQSHNALFAYYKPEGRDMAIPNKGKC